MIKRPQIKLNTVPQLDIFSAAANHCERKKQGKCEKSDNKTASRRFVAPSPDAITPGNTCLKYHLKLTGQKTPFAVANLLDEQNWVVGQMCCSA